MLRIREQQQCAECIASMVDEKQQLTISARAIGSQNYRLSVPIQNSSQLHCSTAVPMQPRSAVDEQCASCLPVLNEQQHSSEISIYTQSTAAHKLPVSWHSREPLKSR